MQKAQYGILRFAKYKGPEISNIEAHNERKKEKYASNPDIDNSRGNLNYHLIEPVGKYRAESNRSAGTVFGSHSCFSSVPDPDANKKAQVPHKKCRLAL